MSGMRLEWNNEQDLLDIDQSLIDLLERLLAAAAEAEGIGAGEVALSFVDNERIQQLNLEYRQLDQPTDVLSFPMQESGEQELEVSFEEGEESDEAAQHYEELLGDIVISVAKAKSQSEEYGHSFERELGFLFVHGFLHLIGYDHHDEAAEKEMFAKQESVLASIGLLR